MMDVIKENRKTDKRVVAQQYAALDRLDDSILSSDHNLNRLSQQRIKPIFADLKTTGVGKEEKSVVANKIQTRSSMIEAKTKALRIHQQQLSFQESPSDFLSGNSLFQSKNLNNDSCMT